MRRAPFPLVGAAGLLAALALAGPAFAGLRLDPKTTPDQLGACYAYVGTYVAAARGMDQSIDPFWTTYMELIQARGGQYGQAELVGFKSAADTAMADVRQRKDGWERDAFFGWLTAKVETCSELAIES